MTSNPIKSVLKYWAYTSPKRYKNVQKAHESLHIITY